MVEHKGDAGARAYRRDDFFVFFLFNWFSNWALLFVFGDIFYSRVFYIPMIPV